MNKQEFLEELREELMGLPQDEIEERLDFYSEMIEDRMEEGLSEEVAVAEIGIPAEIAAQIIEDIPLTRFVVEKVKPKRKLKVWEIVLLVLGSPIWVPLLLAAIVIALAIGPVGGGGCFGSERRCPGGSGVLLVVPRKCARGHPGLRSGRGLRRNCHFPVLRVQGSDPGNTDSDKENHLQHQDAADGKGE